MSMAEGDLTSANQESRSQGHRQSPVLKMCQGSSSQRCRACMRPIQRDCRCPARKLFDVPKSWFVDTQSQQDTGDTGLPRRRCRCLECTRLGRQICRHLRESFRKKQPHLDAQLEPAGQLTHAVAFPRLYCPGGHGSGAAAALGHREPAGHALQ